MGNEAYLLARFHFAFNRQPKGAGIFFCKVYADPNSHSGNWIRDDSGRSGPPSAQLYHAENPFFEASIFNNANYPNLPSFAV